LPHQIEAVSARRGRIVVTAAADDAAQPRKPLMTAAKLAAYLGGGITEGTLAQWRFRGTGPDFIKAGRRVLYRPEVVEEWLAEHEHSARAS
jgi:hypothetical protein